jgi:hypothetical protein
VAEVLAISSVKVSRPMLIFVVARPVLGDRFGTTDDDGDDEQ